MPDFAHLHLHTQFSLLDGAIRLEDLFPSLLRRGMKTVAITDHGNLFGALKFYKDAKAHGVKPVFGCETYVAPGSRHEKETRKNYHLILLARDREGWHNLSYLISMAYLEGFHQFPRIDKQLLRDRRGGLIGFSACLGGEIAQTLRSHGVAAAREVARGYRDLFEPGCFFLELMPNGLEEQEQLNAELIKLARELSIPLVATNDCHYLDRGDARAHDVLMCIQTGKTVADPRRMHHRVDSYWLKTPAEMEGYFAHLPEAMENAARIGELCNVDLDLSHTYLPRYQVPEGETLESYMTRVAEQGLEARLAQARRRGRVVDADLYRARLAHELAVIAEMGFAGYFLIVWDFIDQARKRGIPVGPGRGSGAGSLVAYALRITDLDPLEHRLLFERFLNPERVSMPDFDVDFCMNRRDEVIRYVQDKYGAHNVGQIATMQMLKARAAIKDVARAMGLSFSEADRLAKLVPEPVQGKPPKLKEALANEPRLKAEYDKDPRAKDVIDVAMALENLNRHAGMHAAGIVIAEKPLWEYVPCFRGPDGELVTQFSKDEVEQAGLVKFDFLGLKTLTVIDIAARLIRAGAGPEQPAHAEFRIEDLPLDDARAYDVFARGDTTAVFQSESSGFREMLKKLRPDRFDDIVAAVALYRPGPMDMIDDFVRRKHGQTKVVYLHPALAPILADTYGVIVYQEQVMQIASALAGFTLGQADLLRRAMGKKKPEEMAKQKSAFIQGAVARGVDERSAAAVFDQVEPFAGYAFNRSHAAAYALLAYQTAYLKAHFPVEFMAAVLECEKDKQDNLARFIAEARQMGIEVRRPDVNESSSDFSVVRFRDGRKVIRFGLSAVKGVGEGAVEAMLAARAAGGPFASLVDFCERVDARKANRKVLEALACAGGFDGLARDAGAHRAAVFAAIERAQEIGGQAQRDRDSGQASLFARLAAPVAERRAIAYPDVPEWTPKELLAREKEALGFYITGHPLDRYADDVKRYANARIADLESRGDGAEVALCGLVAGFREKLLKTGKRMAFFNLEDQSGMTEVICWSTVYEKVEAVLRSDDPLLCDARIRMEGDEGVLVPRLILEDARPLAQVRAQQTRAVHLYLDADAVGRAELERLSAVLEREPGDCPVVLHLRIPKRSETLVELPRRFAVKPSDDLLLAIERLFGPRTAVLR